MTFKGKRQSFDFAQDKKAKGKSFLGFTLIELLVVISIIGILAALLSSSYSQAQKQGRDAKRKGDLKSIQSALEQYKTAVGTYPGGNYPGDTDVPPTGIAKDNYFQNNVIPKDPRSGANYAHPTYSLVAYQICADLETILTWSDTSPTNDICVMNLQ